MYWGWLKYQFQILIGALRLPRPAAVYLIGFRFTIRDLTRNTGRLSFQKLILFVATMLLRLLD